VTVERAVVIGLDSFDPGIALDLVHDGRLPTLAGLLESTSWARTLSPPGMTIGATWPSITTGCLPSRHGFYCDRQLKPGTYEARHTGPRDITQIRL
jgi:predicted AlkP superfamily phosphohydrolase/phosphomutase